MNNQLVFSNNNNKKMQQQQKIQPKTFANHQLQVTDWTPYLAGAQQALTNATNDAGAPFRAGFTYTVLDVSKGIADPNYVPVSAGDAATKAQFQADVQFMHTENYAKTATIKLLNLQSANGQVQDIQNKIKQQNNNNIGGSALTNTQ